MKKYDIYDAEDDEMSEECKKATFQKAKKIIIFLVAIFLFVVIVMAFVIWARAGTPKEIPIKYPEKPVDSHLSINGQSVRFGDSILSYYYQQNDSYWSLEKQMGRRNALKDKYDLIYTSSPSSHFITALNPHDSLMISSNADGDIELINIYVENLYNNIDYSIGDYRVTNETTIEDIGKALNRDVSTINDAPLYFHIRDVYMKIVMEDGKLRIIEKVIPDEPSMYEEVETSGEFHDSPKYNVRIMFPKAAMVEDRIGYNDYDYFVSEKSPLYEVEGNSVFYLQDGKRYFELKSNSKNKDGPTFLTDSHFKVKDLPDDKLFGIGTFNVTNKTTFDELKKAFGREDLVGNDSVNKIKGKEDSTYYYVELLDDGNIDIRSW